MKKRITIEWDTETTMCDSLDEFFVNYIFDRVYEAIYRSNISPTVANRLAKAMDDAEKDLAGHIVKASEEE